MSTSSSCSKRRQTLGHYEPPPFQDERAPSARLARAIQSSSLHLVRRLLETALNPDGSPLDPRQPDPVTRKTSLIVAAEVGDLDMCRMLIEEYNVESETPSRDPENNTVIHLAAARGSTDIISLYHTHYAHVLDWANSAGMTALHVASQKGHEATVSLLLDLQADVELTDNEGNTCLHYAAGWGHLKIVLLLIDRGCSFWAKNNNTFTASDYAYSFSIQSALQESARAHFESRKSQQRHRQRDREKERVQRSAAAAAAAGNSAERAGSPSSSSFRSRRAPPVRTEETPPALGLSLAAPNRSTSMPHVNPLTGTRIPPSPNSYTTPTPANMKKSSGPAVMHSSTKPLVSPTSSFTAKTVSHLMTKDLEAIQEFRTRSGSVATSLASSSTGAGMGLTPSPNLTTHFPSDSPTGAGLGGGGSSRLIPLQLSSTADRAGASGSGPGSAPSLRPRRSSGNVMAGIAGAQANGGRHRAGSTDSDKSGPHSFRDGISRLRYLKGNAGTGARPPPLVLQRVPGSPVVVEDGAQGAAEGEYEEYEIQDG